MHTQDARKQGETEQRLYLLNAWRESPLYTDRERAALAWTEAVTLIAETHAPDDVYEEVRAHFSEAETVNLTMLIGGHQCLEPDRDQLPRHSSGKGEGRGGVRPCHAHVMRGLDPRIQSSAKTLMDCRVSPAITRP